MKVIQLDRFRRGEDGHIMIPYEAAVSCDCVYSVLPSPQKKSYLYLDTSGGYTDIFIGGECIDTAGGSHRKLVSLDGHPGRELKLRFISEGTVARDVKLFTSQSDAYILPYGLYASVKSYDGAAAVIEVTADIENGAETSPCELEVAILNKRGKRISSRIKKLTLKSGMKTVKLDLKLRSVSAYSQADPYMYTVEAKLTGPSGEDSAKAVYGVRGDAQDALAGAFISPTAGVIAGISTFETEAYRLNALKALGYNTVRFSACPSDAALDAMDGMGFKCIVDIFDNWSQPKGNTLAHIDFKRDRAGIIKQSVRALRCHPSVIMYSAGNCVDESYGRADPAVLDEIVSGIKEDDGSRFITAALGELVPTASELERCGVPKAEIRAAGDDPGKLTELARKCDLFNTVTESFALRLDIVGLSNVSAEGSGGGRPVYFAATSPENAHEYYSEFDRADDILGDISDCGIAPRRGDLDWAYRTDTAGLYRKTVKGESGAFIATGKSTDPLCAKRNWSGYEPGEKVRIYVFAAADVVALHLNGRLIGRKLAGKVNNFIAAFETEYVPGKLEAICYAMGKETGRCCLETVQPRALKVDPPRSVCDGGIAVVGISVTGGDGQAAAGTEQLITVTAEGGEIVRLGNGSGVSTQGGQCPAYEGNLLAVIRTDKGISGVTVTATAEGLKRGRATIKIKAGGTRP